MNIPIDWPAIWSYAGIGLVLFVMLVLAMFSFVIALVMWRHKFHRELGYFMARFKYRPKRPVGKLTVKE